MKEIKIFRYNNDGEIDVREVDVDLEPILEEVQKYDLVEYYRCYSDDNWDEKYGSRERITDLCEWIDGENDSSFIYPEAILISENGSFLGVMTEAKYPYFDERGILLTDGSCSGKTSFHERSHSSDHYVFEEWSRFSLRKKSETDSENN